MTTTRLLASTVALIGVLSALSVDLAATFEGKVLHVTDSGLKSFVFDAHSRLLRVTFKENREKLSAFASHYKVASGLLQKYGIQLGQLNCDQYPKFETCARPNADLFLYGFRGSLKEKLSLPINTLADENAIVASALHLELIHVVPIVQSVNEFEDLYKKCAKKCDIVISYHTSLGTKEHSLYLSLAWRMNSADRIFALSTSSLASPFRQENLSEQNAKQHVHLWLVQCKMHECEHSAFTSSFTEHQLDKFVESLDLPTTVKLTGPLEEVLDGQMLRYPQLIAIYDKNSKKRVASLAKALATTFRGAVLVSVASEKDFKRIAGENVFALDPPSLLFLPFRNGTLLKISDGVLQNGFENVYNFVREQLIYEHNQHNVQHERTFGRYSTNKIEINPLTEPYTSPSKFTSATQQCASGKELEIRLYYLEWDEASQSVLRLLDRLETRLETLPVRSVSRVNCFTDRDDCEHVHTFPTFEFSDSHTSSQHAASLSWIQLNRLIFKLGNKQPVKEIEFVTDLLKELDSPKYEFIEALALLVDSEGTIGREALKFLPLYGIDVLVARGEAASYLSDKLNCTVHPCFGIQKFSDPLEPLIKFEGIFHPDDHKVKSFIEAHKYPIYPELCLENWERLGSKLLVVGVGLDPSASGAQSISESAIRRAAAADGPVAFSYITRRAASYEPVRRTHLPPALDSGLVALNRSLGASFLFAGDVTDARQIEHWIDQILTDKLQPTVMLTEKDWAPSAPAIDYLALSEQIKNDQNLLPDGDVDDLFIATDHDLRSGLA